MGDILWRNFRETNFCELKKITKYKESIFANRFSSYFNENELSWKGKYIQPRQTVQFFKSKVRLTFDDLVFADIISFAVISAVRGIEN